MDAKNPTQIAVLGTLAEFHRDPLPYDLTALVDLLAEMAYFRDKPNDNNQQKSGIDL